VKQAILAYEKHVPGTNQYKAMRVNFLAQGNNKSF